MFDSNHPIQFRYRGVSIISSDTDPKGQKPFSILERLKPKIPVFLLIVLIVFGGMLRFYRLSELTIFATDQSRDLNVVRSMAESGVPTLVGPPSSQGHFHRGPIYFYILLPAFLIGRGDPAFVAALIGVIDLITLYLLYSVGRSYFGIWVGLSAAALWATAPMIITFARWIWNPNPLPLLVMLMMKSMVEIVRGKSRYLILLGSAWIIAWQLHDEALFLLPAVAAFALTFRPSIPRRTYYWTLFAVFLLLLPYVLDEIIHNFANTTSMARYIFLGASSGEGFISKAATRLSQTFFILDSKLVPGSGYLHFVFQLLLPAGLLQLLRSYNKAETRHSAIIFLFWVMTPLLYVFWPGKFYDHYLEILFPVVFLLLGLGILALRQLNLWIGYVSMSLLVAFVLFTGWNQMEYFRRMQPPPRTLGATKAVVKYILKRANGNSFAFQLISKVDIALPYLYIFSQQGTSPVRRADVEKYVVCDPYGLSPTECENGIVINGLKIVEYPAPALGANLIRQTDFSITGVNRFQKWILPQRGAVLDASSGGNILILDGRSEGAWNVRSIEKPAGGSSFAKRILRVQGNREYVIRFDHRVLREPGSPRVSVQLLNDQEQKLDLGPNKDGFTKESRLEWTTNSFQILTPPDAKYAWLWLTNAAHGRIAYRNVEVRIIKKQKDEPLLDSADR